MPVRQFSVPVFAAVALLIGCQTTPRVGSSDYARVSHTVQQVSHTMGAGEEAAAIPIATHLEGAHAVDDYIQFALGQNPDIQVARKRMEAFAYKVPVAASLQDPTLNATFFPEEVQTAAGQQVFGLAASQKLPAFGKLDRRASLAESQTNVARAELAAIELSIIEKVKQTYYELYFVEQAIAITESEQQLLVGIRDVANIRYKSNRTSQQDVLRAELEISNIENDLIQLRQQLIGVQARLARILHISSNTNLHALEVLPPEQIPQNLSFLKQQAVTARPELHAQLAALMRDQQSVELAHLDYRPDLTLSATWNDVSNAGISPVANGRDAFLIGAGINLPIYRKRLDASVKSAEANAVASARKYDSLRDVTLEEVTDLFTLAQSQYDLLSLFRDDIVPKARQTLEVSTHAYNVGEVDFLQLIDNWQQLLKYEIRYRRYEASLRQTTAKLERVVGGFTDANNSDVSTGGSIEVPLPASQQE